MIGILAPLPVARSGYRGAAAFRECSMKFNLMVSSARERRTVSHSSEFHRRTSHPLSSMPLAKVRALTILGALAEARSELVGKTAILTDGEAGTVEQVWLDEHHGLRISIRGHYGKWPVSTIKLAQS